MTSYSIRRAVQHALLLSAAAVASMPVQAAEDTISEVVVTGSRLRRVDQETANPILVIDQSAIAASGITSAGDLVSRIPSVSGAASNPQVNNGGGFGEANIELRGLDAKRTLILVDGRRIGLVGGTADATDVNQIPLGLIERVEVLKEGAGAIYGSDAIGGVVNFITRKNVDGLTVNTDYGATTHNDGDHYSVDALFGSSTDKGSFIIGGGYTHQDSVSAGNRDFSKFALYLYGGTTGIRKGGSSRTPNGRITLPAGNSSGCTGDVTRIAGASGASTSDYRCYNGAIDAFNFQPQNLLLTPQERTSIFAKANYNISESVEAYATVINNRTHSGFAIAPLPFDARTDDVVISKNNIYNPFGVDFGGLTTGNPNFLLRMSSLGQRQSDTASDSKVFNGGVRGQIFDTGWDWDLNLNTSRLDQQANVSGYLLKAGLGPALGPSFIDPVTGTPTCGTLASPISGCVPVNFFNPTAASQVAALRNISANFNTKNKFTYESASIEVNGKAFDLPAGEFLSAFGFEYNNREGSFLADSIVQATPPLYLQCQLANETCTGNTLGEYHSRQLFAEFYVPLLKDLPGVDSLAVDVGVRYSDYSIFGDSTKGDFKVEYRPVKDLLVRGTYSQVFRVPTVTDIAASPLNNSVTFNDPCTGLTNAMVAQNPNLALACVGVPRTGNFEEPNGQITGLDTSNPNLKPETGNVKTFGLVYEPQFVSGLSLEVDYWKYHIEGLITTVDANFSIEQCVATGNPQFCNLVQRFTTGTSAGEILVFEEPTLNLGELDTDGIDLGVKYVLPNTGLGSFQFSVDTTRINAYDNQPGPGATKQEIAGTFDRQFGNYAKWRAVAQIGWSLADFEALVSARYIDKLVVHGPSVSGFLEDGTTPFPDLKIPSVTYLDASFGYTLPLTNTKFAVGLRNATDEQPPVFYINNVANANTDVETYDTIGRQWWARITQKF